MANEYGEIRGGLCYYTQNKFGTEWFDKADNKKGWTVDFNLRVDEVHNSELILDENSKGKGVGIYVNDGDKQETINFLTQEIIFGNAKKTITYDTTTENNYRLTGKEENLTLYSREKGKSFYNQIASVDFFTKATINGNALNPSVFEDSNGNLHATWWDDGGGLGNIFYSKFSDSQWSEPEKIVSLENGVDFPSIIVDSNENIYVIFESKQTVGSAIGLVYKNEEGWSGVYYTGVDIGYCKLPKLTFDSQSNVCIVWEDSRKIHSQIYIDIFLVDELKWRGEEELSSNSYGSYRPSITSYMDYLFISWTRKETNNNSFIEVIKYNAISKNKSSVVSFSDIYLKADFSNILANVSGKVFVVWHDNLSGSYQIYGCILSSFLDIIYEPSPIVGGYGGSKYPVLSEHSTTSDVYIVWQDYKDEEYSEFVIDPSDVGDPYSSSPMQDTKPASSAIFVAVYKDGEFLSSGAGSFDVRLNFIDNRNAYVPSVPVFFNGELPILYESSLVDEYGFVRSDNLLLNIRHAFYDLSREDELFSVNYGSTFDEYGEDRDFVLNKNAFTKEIRFGDFSDVLNISYVFKNFKYYLGDNVEPYSIKEVTASTVPVGSLSAHSSVVNNYGDVWIIGLCGIYYYRNKYNKIYQVDPKGDIPGLIDQGEISDEVERDNLKKFKVIAFDKYNTMFIGGDHSAGIRYSLNHDEGFKIIELDGVQGKKITSFVFDKDNTLFVGTESGVFRYRNVDYKTDKTIVISEPSLTEDNFLLLQNYPTNEYITSLSVDENNCLWVGTSKNGLYRFFKNRFLHFTTANGLSSNVVNDIAIRNTAIRYIATSNGINKMMGFNLSNYISSSDSTIWNNNVKSLMWKDPNILLAGTLSKLNQITIDDDNDIYTTSFYEPAAELNTSGDDLDIYYITDGSISSNDIIDVYINGNLIHYGYDVSLDRTSIRFKMSLNNYDIVEVVSRKKIEKISSFSQSQGEKESDGNNIVKIKDLAINSNDNSIIYASVEGAYNEVKINDSNSILPFDKVHLDTLAPFFKEDEDGIKIGSQIDKSLVRVTISGATDNILDSDGNIETEGSGIDQMVISNYENFTTNGIVEKESVPFATSILHDLGLSLEDIELDFNFTSGYGSVVTYIPSDNELYAASSKPAVVYKYSWENGEWEELYAYNEDQYVDFITKYNNKLIVSVGHDIESSKLYTYNYIDGGLEDAEVLSISESRSYCSYELDGKLYIGVGIGDGNEYSEGSGSGGSLYLFNDGTLQNVSPNISKVVENVDENIYSLTNVEGSSNLLSSTGPNGYIYEIDIENKAAFIIYNGLEALTSISYFKQGENGLIFVGGETDGKIRRSFVGNNSYDISFSSIPSKISSLKIFPVIISSEADSNYASIYAAVGNILYYLSNSGSWVWKYTHTEVINDMTFNNSSNVNVLYIISDSGITKINPLLESKNIYLKLIDRAGNETVFDTTLSIEENKFADSINIEDLSNFVNENKIFEIDELGNTTYNLRGNNKFYSADKIEEERGEYLSEIFDGSNDLVKWESISWRATELFNTQVLMYVRTSTSQNDILVADWVGPYYTYQSSGIDLSALVGQFIQFKVVLISSEKGITPTFSQANIRAVTSESIHFFTTNFSLPSRINKGIITSQKVIPVSADIVFGINTNNSIDWTEYQPVDENRLFNVDQVGQNLRVGIKLLSPNRSIVEPSTFDEYGPYGSDLFVNTINFLLENNSGVTNNYHFRVSLYEDINLNNLIYSAYSATSPDGFSADGQAIPEEGYSISHGSSSDVLFNVPGTANITCNTYYFVKIEYIYDVDFVILSEDNSFISGCTSSFIDTIDFDFTNDDSSSNYYHFRIKFYTDPERTSEYLTVFSGNDRSGWFINDTQITDDGALVSPGNTVNIMYSPDVSSFSVGSIYYLTIDAHDGDNYVFSTSAYTFQIKDVLSEEYCGEYLDVPIVKNFGIMIELDNNEFINFNI